MQDFYQQAIRFLFRQGVAVVICIVFAAVLWLKIGSMEAQSRLDRIEIRRECAQDISEIRADLKNCQNENDTLRRENDTLRRENIDIHRRLSRLESRINKK